MKFEYNYSIDLEKRLMRHEFSGPLSADDIIACFKQLIADKDFDGNYCLLTDLRLADLEMKSLDVKRISTFLSDKLFGRSAILVSSPQQAALSSLHIHNVSDVRTINLFSTEIAALGYLGIGV